jgi:hypothetical protein
MHPSHTTVIAKILVLSGVVDSAKKIAVNLKA